MKFYEVRRDIAASPASVWKVLTDTPSLASGKTGIIRMEGTMSPAARLKIWSEISPSRAFPVQVAAFEPASRMIWEGGMPLGLFRGVRTFTLSPSERGTNFHMREEFSGLMLPLIWRSMPDLTPSFEKFADGLREMAEAQHAGQ